MAYIRNKKILTVILGGKKKLISNLIKTRDLAGNRLVTGSGDYLVTDSGDKLIYWSGDNYSISCNLFGCYAATGNPTTIKKDGSETVSLTFFANDGYDLPSVISIDGVIEIDYEWEVQDDVGILTIYQAEANVEITITATANAPSGDNYSISCNLSGCYAAIGNPTTIKKDGSETVSLTFFANDGSDLPSEISIEGVSEVDYEWDVQDDVGILTIYQAEANVEITITATANAPSGSFPLTVNYSNCTFDMETMPTEVPTNGEYVLVRFAPNDGYHFVESSFSASGAAWGYTIGENGKAVVWVNNPTDNVVINFEAIAIATDPVTEYPVTYNYINCHIDELGATNYQPSELAVGDSVFVSWIIPNEGYELDVSCVVVTGADCQPTMIEQGYLGFVISNPTSAVTVTVTAIQQV